MSIFEKVRDLAVINSSAAVIGWDQETYLPAAANDYRAKQLAWLSSKAHQLATSEAWKKDLETAENTNPGSDPKLTATQFVDLMQSGITKPCGETAGT